MPELPEVETIVRALALGGRGGPPILGWQVKSVHLLWARTLASPGAEEFGQRLMGQRIVQVGRRGKFVVISFDRDVMLIHLRMSGDLRVESSVDLEGKELPFQPHDRLVIEFSHQMRLCFNDTRKFGRVWLTHDPSEITAKLGTEPLSEALSAQEFHERLRARNRPIKPLLLDQSFLSGLGNIYTDEALFLAKIHPLQAANTLDFVQAEQLLVAIRQTLNEGIYRNGASFDWVYKGGKFVFQVYQRTGKACPICGTPIERIVVGQRSTHYCPTCQVLTIKIS